VEPRNENGPGLGPISSTTHHVMVMVVMMVMHHAGAGRSNDRYSQECCENIGE
jgi:hypothetical protein